MASQAAMAHQDILWLLGSLCSLYRIPFDPKLVEQDCPPPHNLATFHEAARAIGFKNGQSAHPADWQKLPLPAIAFLRAVPETPSKEAVPTIPVLILKADATKQAPLGGSRKLLYFRAGSQSPETITIEEAADQLEPELILVSREASGTNKDGEIPGFDVEKNEFGFKWFIPELLKHKTIWRDVLLGLLGTIAFISFLVAPVFRDKLNQQFMLGARNQSFLTEYVAGMATVKSLQMEADIDKKYGDFLAQYLAAGFSTKQIGNTYNVISNGLEQVMTLAILIVGALLVMQNDGFTIGMLVAFQMFAGRMNQPLLRLVGLWQEFQQANIAVKRLGDILDMPQEPHTLTPTRENQGPGRIDLNHLAFRYSEHHPWLYKNLSLTLKPGRLTVLMGPSGCGKSTLAKLLLGFYQPKEGQINLDGKDVANSGEGKALRIERFGSDDLRRFSDAAAKSMTLRSTGKNRQNPNRRFCGPAANDGQRRQAA